MSKSVDVAYDPLIAIRALDDILVQLSYDNIDTIVDRIIALNISTAAHLNDVAVTIFDRAIAEPARAPMYAELCLKLSVALPKFPSIDGAAYDTQDFKRLLLNQCQIEFENDDDETHGAKYDLPTTVSRTGVLTHARIALLSSEERASYAAQQKRRRLCTIRFIGELYVRNMMSVKIMLRCLALLAGDPVDEPHVAPNDENLEVLCTLINTNGLGKLIDNNAERFMQQLFDDTLQVLTHPPSAANADRTDEGRPVLSSRMRLVIQRTIELRQRGWRVEQ